MRSHDNGSDEAIFTLMDDYLNNEITYFAIFSHWLEIAAFRTDMNIFQGQDVNNCNIFMDILFCFFMIFFLVGVSIINNTVSRFPKVVSGFNCLGGSYRNSASLSTIFSTNYYGIAVRRHLAWRWDTEQRCEFISFPRILVLIENKQAQDKFQLNFR